jgi:aspartate kinase
MSEAQQLDPAETPSPPVYMPEEDPASSSSSSSSSSLSGPPTPPNLHQNTIDPAAKWLVQKFGGTSVGKFAVTIAEDIVSCVSSQKKNFFLICAIRV